MSEPTVIQFIIPGVLRPLERNRHRIVTKRDGGQFVSNYLPSKSRAEQAGIKLIAAAAMQGRPPITGPVELRVALYVPIPASWSQKKRDAALRHDVLPTSRPDCTNWLKQIEDGMNKIVYNDDSQITDCLVQKRYCSRPRVVVELRERFAR